MAKVMFHLYVKHHWPPSAFFNLGFYEKKIVTAFVIKEMEEAKRVQDELDKMKG